NFSTTLRFLLSSPPGGRSLTNLLRAVISRKIQDGSFSAPEIQSQNCIRILTTRLRGWPRFWEGKRVIYSHPKMLMRSTEVMLIRQILTGPGFLVCRTQPRTYVF